MAKLLPGEAIIYERADGVVYARYRDPPHNNVPRWIIGGDSSAVAKAQGKLLDYSEWQDLCRLAKEHSTLEKLLDQLVTMYYVVKDKK